MKYIGKRYVPLICGEWSSDVEYESLSIVTYGGNSYASRKEVPKNIDINNTDYWIVCGNYNAQIEQALEDIKTFKTTINNTVTDFTTETNTKIEDFTNEYTPLKKQLCLGIMLLIIKKERI